MQRLYSTFARGWPGVGLLCLRLITAISASPFGVAGLHPPPTLPGKVIEGAAGLLLCAGIGTPIAGVVLAALAICAAFSTTGDPWSQIQLAAMSAGLAMLGPGAWSIDSRLFGRKRLIREP